MTQFKFLLIPFATRNVAITEKGHVVLGYTEYFVFGIRVAKIQKTEPWSQ